MIMTDDMDDSQARCATHPAEARMGTRDRAGPPLPPGPASTAPDLAGFEREFTVGSGDVELAAQRDDSRRGRRCGGRR